MSAFQIFTQPSQQALDTAASVLSGATLTFLVTGTSTPTDAYSEPTLTTPLANPLSANAAGVFVPVFLDPEVVYRIILKTQAGVTLQTWDPANENVIALITSQYIGLTLDSLKRTAAEIAAGVTPVNYAYGPGDVRRYGALGDDATNDWSAFDQARRSNDRIIVPNLDYLVQGTALSILDGQTWLFEGGQIRHTDVDGTIFEAIEKSDFAILGKIILKGTLTGAAANDEVGLYIEKCKRYRVEGVEARLFTGIGIHLSGDTSIPGNFRGERGQFTDCAVYENTVGLQIDVGAASEYNTWTNFQAAGNVLGIDVAAGNNTFIGGNVVDNTEGVYVRNGSNHAHGIFSGVNINHNTSFNIKCEGVTNGQTFVGCHVYGDSAFAGYIWFVNSKGCQVINGTIDAPIQCDGTTGLNFITGNFIAGATNPVISGTDPEKLILRGNYTGTAPWSLDDPADVYVQATRGTSTQSLTTGNTEVVIFNNEEKDNRSAFDPTTGIFTAPYTGRYQFICTMYLTGASGMSATFMEFYKNNTTTINFGSLVYNATNVLGTMTLDINMDAGDTMRVRVTSNGVTPVVAVDKTRFMAKLLH
jgi:hypothetical protein